MLGTCSDSLRGVETAIGRGQFRFARPGAKSPATSAVAAYVGG